MKAKAIIGVVTGFLLATCAVIPLSVAGSANDLASQAHLNYARRAPRAPALAFVYSAYRTAPLTVAKVFGRSQGCFDADPELIEATASAAIQAGLDPAIAAATVAVESGCNQFAISSRGAIGLTQVMPRIWKDHFDFAGDVNLFNRDANLRTGTKIEAGLIQEYGISDGVWRYQGIGVDCSTCDSGYTSKILTLAGRK
jgi:soluble lytic murein transglycosylase-like protein